MENSSSKDTQNKPTSFRLEPELLKRVQKACIDLDTSVTAVVEQGFVEWLNRVEEGSALRNESLSIPVIDQLNPEQKQIVERVAVMLQQEDGKGAVLADMLDTLDANWDRRPSKRRR